MTMTTRNETTKDGLGLVLAKLWVGSLAMTSLVLMAYPLTQEDPSYSWRSCLNDPAVFQSATAGPGAALATAHASHLEASRVAELHRQELQRLRQDPRWDQEDQVAEIRRAADAEWEKAAEQEALADDAMATAGCIENEF